MNCIQSMIGLVSLVLVRSNQPELGLSSTHHLCVCIHCAGSLKGDCVCVHPACVCVCKNTEHGTEEQAGRPAGGGCESERLFVVVVSVAS